MAGAGAGGGANPMVVVKEGARRMPTVLKPVAPVFVRVPVVLVGELTVP